MKGGERVLLGELPTLGCGEIEPGGAAACLDIVFVNIVRLARCYRTFRQIGVDLCSADQPRLSGWDLDFPQDHVLEFIRDVARIGRAGEEVVSSFVSHGDIVPFGARMHASAGGTHDIGIGVEDLHDREGAASVVLSRVGNGEDECGGAGELRIGTTEGCKVDEADRVQDVEIGCDDRVAGGP